MNKKYYATEGLAIYEFSTKASLSAFVLEKQGRSVLNVPTCLECGHGLFHQEESHAADHEFYYTCDHGHICHDDGVPLSNEELIDRDATRAFYDQED